MRVIAGRFKGRHLQAPKGTDVRPTADRVKEALFSILGPRIMGARVLDLYAGTGALGIEALSRGAVAVTFVEHHPKALRILRNNLRECGLHDQVEVVAGRVDDFVARSGTGLPPYHLVLADPPYEAVAEFAGWGHCIQDGLLTDEGILILEHAQKSVPTPSIGRLQLVRSYTYGDTALSLYRVRGGVEATA